MPDEALTAQPETDAAPEPEVSLAEHEAQFGPHAEPLTDDAPVAEPVADATSAEQIETSPQPKGKGRHRARSQQATPADAPRIAELTKHWREAQAKIADLEARLSAPPPRRQEPPAAFEEKEPALEQFAQEPDPYLALARAQAAYDRRKDAAEAAQRQHTEAETADGKAQIERVTTFFNAKHQAHTARMDAYITANPESRADFDAVKDETVTPVMAAAITLLEEESARALHVLVRDQALRDELVLHTLGKDITPSLVAIVQRRLRARMQAATTGSAAPAQRPVIVPRPPNPVRTAPVHAVDEPPGDDASVADHARAYFSRRR